MSERRKKILWGVVGVVLLIRFYAIYKEENNKPSPTPNQRPVVAPSVLPPIPLNSNSGNPEPKTPEKNFPEPKPTQDDWSAHIPDSVTIARLALAAAVGIRVEDEDGKPIVLGSGFYVGKNLVATNYHVVSRTPLLGALKVGPGDRTVNLWVRAERVVVTNEEHDLALVSVVDNSYPHRSLPLTDVEPEVGERVFVVGNPHGLLGTFTSGLVSAIRLKGRTRVIQFDAPISSGSSGGPILDEGGQVIAITTASYDSGQNLNFGVAAVHLQALMKEARRPRW